MTRHIQMMDAQVAVGFVRAQAEYIETVVNETVYPDIQYARLVPVDTGADPFVDTVLYISSDKFGKADWINGNADDIPLAGTSRAQFRTGVHTAGIGYGFGWEEINKARRFGINLEAEDAVAARRAYEEMVDRVVLRGDSAKGFSGLFNYPGIGRTAAPAAFVDATPVNVILGAINDMLMAGHVGTGYTSFANTVLMSPEKLAYLATRRLSDDSETTVLAFLRANNVVTLTTGQQIAFIGAIGLSEAGDGGTQRMIAYRRDPQVLKLHLPMPHRFLPAQQDGVLSVVVPGVFRMGGVDIRRPAEFRYMDGI